MSYSLTAAQLELLDFIKRRIEANGYAPSFEEMKEHLGLKSKSGVHRLVRALEDRGHIRTLPFRACAIELVKPGDSPRIDELAALQVILRPIHLEILKRDARAQNTTPARLIREMLDTAYEI